ncbi:hypothetical protein BB8028_0002g01950 [Beauveria bassiana]|uniref:Uncharacterized protein n=1 Tax=Beauveria bassiana TaxID=176275 RepID=A0A2S7Y176_BEABA|nr:hypothetical protein BB8028_0002g01950 [Beauveria bassiana]
MPCERLPLLVLDLPLVVVRSSINATHRTQHPASIRHLLSAVLQPANSPQLRAFAAPALRLPHRSTPSCGRLPPYPLACNLDHFSSTRPPLCDLFDPSSLPLRMRLIPCTDECTRLLKA